MTDREKLIELIRDGRACPIDRNPFDDETCKSCKYLPDVDCDITRLADYLIANGVTFATDTNVGSKWISVEDEKPKGKMIIDGEIYYRTVAVITDDRFAAQKIAFYDEELMDWYQPNDIVPLQNVTHWMLLPELPEEGC